MGLDCIMFYGTAAGAMAALAPTSAVIKGTKGDAKIVGYASLGGTDNTTAILTCPGDPRWEAAGFVLQPGGADAASVSSYAPHWFAKKIPIKEGATLVSTQVGADDFYVAVYVDYAEYGEPFEQRVKADGDAFMVMKTFTAGGAVTAFVISVNAANDNSFQRGKSYSPLYVQNSTAMTTPYFIGLHNTKWNLTTYWPVPLTPIVLGTANFYALPKGLGSVDGGETQFVDFLSTTADTPVCNVNYAYL